MKKPKPVLNPNFKDLIDLCKLNLEEISQDDEDEDTKHYIYESAMEAVFGKDVWEYINDKLE